MPEGGSCNAGAAFALSAGILRTDYAQTLRTNMDRIPRRF